MNADYTTRLVRDIKAGDHIIDPYHGRPSILVVRHVEPYTGKDGDPMVAIVCRGGVAHRLAADDTITLASAEEIAAARREAVRRELADALRKVADTIEKHELPVRDWAPVLPIELTDPEALRALASQLGLEIEDGHRFGTDSATWLLPEGAAWPQHRLAVQFIAYTPPGGGAQ